MRTSVVVAERFDELQTGFSVHPPEIVEGQEADGLDERMSLTVLRQRNALVDAVAFNPTLLPNVDTSVLLYALRNEVGSYIRCVEEILDQPAAGLEGRSYR